MKKKSIALTREILPHIGGFAGMSPGNTLVHRFCDAVKAGKKPDSSDLQKLANALEVYRWGPVTPEKNSRFAATLGLKRGKGKSMSAKLNWWAEASSVVRYYAQRDEYLDQGETQKDAEVAARSLIRADAGIGDKAMKNRIKKYDEVSTLMYQVAKLEPG